MASKDITFTIEKHLGEIGYAGRMTKEVNLVSWNEADAKVDIRGWDEEHKRMTKGIALTNEEAEALCDVLMDYFGR